MEILPRLDALDHTVERLTIAILVGPSEMTAFPAGWKGWPGTRTPTMDRTEAGKACASASCPRPMHSFNRRSGAWDCARLRRRGSTSCGWASQRQSVYQLDSILWWLAVELASAVSGSALAARFDHATYFGGTHPQQIHHSRRIPNVTTLRKESLAVKLDRDLSQTHPMRA